MTQEMNSLKEGTEVKVKVQNLSFNGIIRGYASEQPVMGKMYLVQTLDGSHISTVYPYSTCVVPETSISLMSV